MFWLLQANPIFWNLPLWLKDNEEGVEDDWPIPRYQDKIQNGDRVVFWSGGKMAGVYAEGETTSELRPRSPVKGVEAKSLTGNIPCGLT